MTARYGSIAVMHWEQIDGWATSRGIDLLELPLGRFCNLIWHYMIKNAETQQDIDKTRARLWQPPIGVAPTTGPWSAEAETSALSALKAQLTGKSSVTGGTGTASPTPSSSEVGGGGAA